MADYIICRPKNGISLNGLEYLATADGVARFDSIEEARIYLHIKGYTDDDIEAEGIIFKEVENGEEE